MNKSQTALTALYAAAADFCQTDAKALLEKKQLCGEFALPVFGEGATGSALLIGEAPGREETEARRPFVGKAGKTLDDLLTQSQIDRSSLFITNTVKYRPFKLSARGTKSNRAPTRAEISLFLPLLLAELHIIRPRLIIALGNTPLFALTGGAQPITQAHGKPITLAAPLPEQSSMFYNFLPPNAAPFSAALIPLYHPAAAIYDRAKLPLMQKDMLIVQSQAALLLK